MSTTVNGSDFGASSGAHIAPLPRISVQAFCETRDVFETIQKAAKDRRAARAEVKANMGGVAAAIEAFRVAPTPNLVIVETLAEWDTLVRQLDELAEFCDAGTKVVVIGHKNDIAVYRGLVGKGVSDYVVSPVHELKLLDDLSKLYLPAASAGAGPLGRTVAVLGAKGGVGSSTIAHNLAWSISNLSKRYTIVLDLDLPFGTAGLDFNQDPRQGLAEAVFSPERLDATMAERLLTKCGDKLAILAAPATLDRSYDLHEGAFDPLLDILRPSTPFLVLDVPHQWSAWTRRILSGADEILLVAEPDLANLRNVKSLMDLLKTLRPNDRSARLLLNKVGLPKRPEIAPADFFKAVGIDATSEIGFDANLFGVAANNGQMLSEVAPRSKAVALIESLAAETITPNGSRRVRKTGISGFLQGILGGAAR